MTVDQLYEKTIKPLSPAERLRLATLILNDISPPSVVDDSDEWSKEDYRDMTEATWDHISSALQDERNG